METANCVLIKTCDGLSYDIGDASNCLEYCRNIVDHYLSRIAEWDSPLHEMTGCKGHAFVRLEELRQACVQVLGARGYGTQDDDDLYAPPTLGMFDEVTSPLLKFLTAFRQFVWDEVEERVVNDSEDAWPNLFKLAIDYSKESYSFAAKDILGTSLVINSLQRMREALAAKSPT